MRSSLIVAGQLRGVTLEVYNSDPHPPKTRGSLPRLNLNMVYRETVENIYVPGLVPGKLIRGVKVSKDLEGLLSKARGVLSSLYYPLPLALVYACSDFQVDEAVNKLCKVVEVWVDNVEVRGVNVKRDAGIDVEAAYPILLASSTCKHVSGTAKPLEGDFVDVEDLKALGEKVYGRVSELHMTIVLQETSQILSNKEIIEKLKGRDHANLAELRARSLKEKRPPDKRIMIAHAGLQDEYVEARITTENKIAIRYLEDYKKLLKKPNLLIKRKNQ